MIGVKFCNHTELSPTHLLSDDILYLEVIFIQMDVGDGAKVAMEQLHAENVSITQCVQFVLLKYLCGIVVLFSLLTDQSIKGEHCAS